MNRDVGPLLWWIGGIALIVAGAWLLRDGVSMQNWPSVQAESLGARVESRRRTQGRGRGTTYHDIVVSVKFLADDRPVQAAVTAESHLDSGPAQYWASKRYGPGMKIRVWFNPADARDARAQAPDSLTALLPGGSMIAVGALIVGFMALGGRTKVAP
jgi:hypothetical protein